MSSLRAPIALVTPGRLMICTAVCLALQFAPTLHAAEPAAAAQIEHFEARVRPVLVQHCYECHGPTEAKAGLRLDSREGWRKGGDSGPAVVPGNPGGSPLLKAVRHADPAKAMPRDGPRLSDDVVADLERWIRDGAADPRDHAPTPGEASELAWRAKLAERRQ